MDTQVRLSTEADVEAVIGWLDQERRQGYLGYLGSEDDFQQWQQEGRLTALIDLATRQPIAFCVVSDRAIDLIVVRADQRRKGAGTVLAQDAIQRHLDCDAPGIVVECVSDLSAGLCFKIGFSPFDPGRPGRWMIRRFRRTRDIQGEKVPVRISLTSESTGESLSASFETEAALAGGEYLLATEFTEWLPTGDAKVRIERTGAAAREAKVKYAAEHGVEWDNPWVRVRRLTAG